MQDPGRPEGDIVLRAGPAACSRRRVNCAFRTDRRLAASAPQACRGFRVLRTAELAVAARHSHGSSFSQLAAAFAAELFAAGVRGLAFDADHSHRLRKLLMLTLSLFAARFKYPLIRPRQEIGCHLSYSGLMPIRQSFCYWAFAGRGVSDADLLHSAKAIGYEAVELIGEALFDAARDAGLQIAAHSGPQSISEGWNDPAQHPRLLSELDACLALAQKHQIPNLVVFSGNRQSGISDERGLEQIVLGLTRAAALAEDAGVTLVLELLNSKRDHPNYQCDHTVWGAEVCRRVGSPYVKLLYDIYHMQVMEGDLIATIEANHPVIGHYHTAGNPGRQDLDASQEIAYPAVFQAIARTGYGGYIGHEFLPKSEPVAALQAAYDLCRNQL